MYGSLFVVIELGGAFADERKESSYESSRHSMSTRPIRVFLGNGMKTGKLSLYRWITTERDLTAQSR
jgi:hypothetical protein